MATRTTYPPAAVEWLTARRPARVLNLGAGSGFIARLLAEGHTVFAIDPTYNKAAAAIGRRPSLDCVVAQAESLPFDNGSFEAVTAMQNFHTFAPGLALAEAARVLVPGGVLSITYLTRDDTVPWVRRLAAVVRNALPDAMRGDYGDDSIAALEQSKYFPRVESKDFRVWVPISRQGLIDMALGSKGADQLTPDQRSFLTAEVGAVYDGAAKSPDPLLLPYRLGCWRGWVDHTELTAPLEPSEEGLRIRF